MVKKRWRLEEGMDPKIIFNEGLIAGMTIVGQRFKNDEIHLPKFMIAARA